MKIKISPWLKDVACLKQTAVCLSLFLTIVFHNTTNAQSINITTTTDEVNGNTTSLANLASTPGGAGVSLREAIIAANNEPVGANITITIPAGTYTLSIVGNAENGSATGDLDINASAIAGTKTITLNGAGAATTIINTAAAWDDRLFDLEHQSQPGDITVNFNGLTLSGGNVLAGTTSGGAILAGFANNVTNINNCIFSGNSAPNNGGAISQSSGATSHNLTITNTTFSNNTATTAAGGAISYNGVGNVSITGCTFSNNTSGTQGAAINITGSGTGPVSSNMLRNTFTGNTANGSAFGGAAVAVNNAQTININYNRIVNNNAPNVASGKMISTGGGVVGTMNNDNNWWGVNTSPTTTEILGTAAANWLQLKATASPTSIATGGISTVTGSFLTNSANNAVTVANLSTVIGLPITFANPVLGTLSGAQTTIQASGTATVTFTAGGTSGIGSVNTVVDNVPSNESSPAKALITIMGPPTITVTGTPLNAFTACQGSPSADQSFVVSGTDLTANLVVTAPSSFEISLTSGSGYSSSINLIPTGGVVANTTIYIRTTAAATGSPSGNISVSSTGASTTNIPISATISQPPTTANAGTDASTCGLSYTLNGNTPSVGTGTWTYSGPGTISFANMNQGNSGITASVAGIYTLTWTISNGACSPSSGVVNITFVSTPTIANAGTDQQICIAAATTAMTGNTATSGTGTWTQTSGPSTATIVSPNAPNTTINALNVSGTYTFRWTISNPPCTDSYDEVNVVVNPNPAPFTIGGAGTVCQPGSTLNGPSGTNYLYQWASRFAGNVPFTNLGTSQNQPVNQSGIYRLTVTNEFGCSTTSPEVYHNVADYVFTGSLDAADPKQTGRINRFGIVSTCAAPKAFPGLFTASGLRSYDSYTITNIRNVPVCATVGLTSGCGFSLFNAAYSGGGYNPSDPSLNYLADPGSSSSNSIYMEVTIPANSTIEIVVHEVNPGTGCSSYTLTVGVPRDPAAITAVPAAVVCNGTSTLTASVANSYLWSPGGQTTQSITTPPLFNATTFNVTLGYGNNGCTDVAATTVTVSSAPPTVTCSPNIVTNNTIGQCGKSITYSTISSGTPAPTITYSFTGATTGSGNGDGSGSFFNVGVTNVTVTATNACGTASCSFTVTINDTQNPTLTCPAPVTVSCASAVPAPSIAAVTGVSDNCGGVVTITWQGDAISNQTCANRYTITRTYRATDVAGNFAECTQIITVNDQTPPVLTCPAPVTVSCASAVPAPSIAAVTGVSDNCGGVVTITWQGDAISNQTCANRYTITRTYRATDICGNFAECTQIITVNDQTPPVLTCPAPVTVSCASAVPAPSIAAVTGVSDNCGGVVTITWQGDAISNQTCANRYTITRTYRATDICGNFAECTQIITVNDQTPPVLTCPAPVTVSCASAVPAPSIAAVTGVSDNCGGVVTITWQGDAISNQTCANRYTITRTYRATDVCGNFAECTQIITVNDQTPPVLTCPAPVTVSCASAVPAPSIAAVTGVSDNCAGVVTITWQGDAISNQTCANRYTITRTYRATDVCGNFAECTQIITVNDQTPPVLTCPAPVTVSCASAVPAPSIAAVTGVSDNCGGVVTITWQGDAISNQTCANRYTITRTYRATDVCGNFAECTQIITVNDQTAPVITCPAPITVTTPVGSCTALVTFAVTATDNCAGPVTITSSPASGSIFPIGITTVTSTATDACGNSSTCTFTITVKDAQLPVITQQPQNMAVCVGTSATFSVSAITSPSANGPLNYQWQSWNGSAWVNISGAISSSYTISNAALSMNTNSFRVQVIGLCTTVTSGFATLYVNPLPIVSISTSRPPVLLPAQTLTLTAVASPGGGAFQWFKNGIAINGATGSTLGVLTVSDAGTYKVRYTDQNGCVTISADLEVSALQSNLVFIYPNPNNGLFHVRFYNSANEQVTISVFSSNGALAYRKMMTGNLPYTDLEINLGGRVSAGIYTVEVRGNNGKLIGSKQLKIHVPE